MAIKLKNALINLHIEDDEKCISQVICILIEKHGYEPSQIKPSLLISDKVYIEIAEEFGHYEIKAALSAPIEFSNLQELDDYMEQMYNRLIPNREPEHPMSVDVAQQLIQAMTEIEDVNDQIQNSTTRLTNEPLAEGQSNKVDGTSIPKNNTETTKLYRTDKLPSEICQNEFEDIITTSPKKGKQKVLRGIRNNLTHFNPDCFSHEELAIELNNLQRKFVFKKADVDKAYQDKNR